MIIRGVLLTLTTTHAPATDLGTIGFDYSGAAGDDLALSRITQYTDGRGNKVLYTYDDLDRITQLRYKDPGLSTTEATFDYTYDHDGNLTQRVDTAGTTVETYGFTYDGLNRLTLQLRNLVPRTSIPVTRLVTRLPSRLTPLRFRSRRFRRG